MPTIRSDLIDAYIFRRSIGRTTGDRTAGEPTIELLQLRRTDEPMRGTWQPVMGHIEKNETAVSGMWREVAEETGLSRAEAISAWALEQVHPFFMASRDEIMLSPRFAVEVHPEWQPTLNAEHDAHRWTLASEAREHFYWPGQHAAIAELLDMLAAEPPRLAALRLPASERPIPDA